MSQTVFERYGGFAKVRTVVSTFYDYVVDDEVMAPYFTGVDMRNQIDHQSKFIACERFKTMGDGYMAVSGLPEANPEHAVNLAKVALRMRRYIDRRNAAHPEAWRCRIGIHTGPIIGSVVGAQKYVYDIFGPGVNMAARMEALADPMQICISEATWALVRDDFATSELGEVEVKGFGTQRIYSLDAEASGRFA